MSLQVHGELAREDEHGTHSASYKGHRNAAPGEFQGDADKGGVSKVSDQPNAFEDMVPVDCGGFRVIFISDKSFDFNSIDCKMMLTSISY